MTVKTYPIVELLGDGISAELWAAVHGIAAALPCKLEFLAVDLSQATREKRGMAVYDEAEGLMKLHKVSLKYPTATSGISPNKTLRDRCQFSVIHRPVCSI